jgi:hypothetical protein
MELPVGALQQSTKSVAMLRLQVPKGTMTQFGRRCTETGSAQLPVKTQDSRISRLREGLKAGPTEDQATTEIPKAVTAGQSARKEKGEG